MPSSIPRVIIFFLKMAGESSRRSRRFSTGETLALLSDEELFEAEIDPADRAVDLDGESEDEFVAEGDFVDSSGSQALIPDNLLAPDSATILALAVSDTTPAARDSLLLFDPDCNDGKPDIGSTRTKYYGLLFLLQTMICMSLMYKHQSMMYCPNSSTT